MKKEWGFTLVEVLAALLIFSFAIIGLTKAGTESTRAVSVLEHKTYAGIVADNQLIRARMAPLKVGTATGEEKAGGRDYNWRVETSATESAGFFRVIVTVSEKDKDQTVISRTAFRTHKVL